MALQALKGFKDILPDEVGYWQQIEATARSVFHRFGFQEIKVPILEKTELFVRSIGEATDIVEKEMYTFADRNDVSLTMRPEGTASVLRAFIENALFSRQPITKLYTIGPMFRYERPQKGRLRQFHQLSCEVLGADQPKMDAEVMAMAWTLLTELGVSVSLEINSLGCPSCRPLYKETLLAFLDQVGDGVCDDCARRRHTNPLRVLDCKSDNCRRLYAGAPAISAHLCEGCADHFSQVRTLLGRLEIPFMVNSFMVRGLDYYTRTTFELVTGDLGAQSAVGAGGRYDGLVEQLGGPKLPGIGFAMGVERLVLLLQQQTTEAPGSGIDIFVAALGETAGDRAYPLIHLLRRAGIKAALDLDGRSLKSQMKQAARLGSAWVLIVGEDELLKGEAQLRRMADGSQQTISIPASDAALVDVLARQIAS